jgi:glycosyltransferase involved in cell wall biosynthesis
MFTISHLDKILYKYRVHDNTLNAKAKELDLFENIRRLLERDRHRRDSYQKGLNSVWVGFGLENKLSGTSGGTLLAFKYSHKDNHAVTERLGSPDTVSFCVLDEYIDECSIIAKALASADYIITTEIKNFDICYPVYGSKVFHLESIEGNLELLEKMTKCKLFDRVSGLSYEQKPSAIYVEDRKFNIALQVENFDVGGLEQVVYDLATHINRDGFELSVIVTNRNGVIGNKLKSKGVGVYEVNNNIEAYVNLLRDKKLDIINTHYSYLGIDRASEMGMAVVETVHNSYTWLEEEETSDIKNKSKYIDKHIAVSRQVKNYHRRKFNIPSQKISVIPNGLNPEGFNSNAEPKITRESLGYNENDFIFLNVSSFNGIKMHHLMVSVIRDIAVKHPDAKMVFVGNVLDERLQGDIRRRIEVDGLEENIKIFGFLDRRSLNDVYKMADCFILPSLQEGWSIAAMEAMYFGLPLILTDIGSAKEIIENIDIGLLVENPYVDILDLSSQDLVNLSTVKMPSNIAQLKEAMLTMFKNKDYWKTKGEKGKDKIINKFNIQNMVERYEEQFIQAYYIDRKNSIMSNFRRCIPQASNRLIFTKTLS